MSYDIRNIRNIARHPEGSNEKDSNHHEQDKQTENT